MKNQQSIYEENVSKEDANAFQKPKSKSIIDSQFTRRPKSQKEIKDEYDEWKEWANKESSSQQYSVSTNLKHGPTSNNHNTTMQCSPIIYKPEKHVSFFFLLLNHVFLLKRMSCLLETESNGPFHFIEVSTDVRLTTERALFSVGTLLL